MARDLTNRLVGCRGSQKRGLILRKARPEYAWHPAIDWREERLAEPEPIELASSDAAAWHRYYVYGSVPNRSRRPRRGVVRVFVDRTRRDLSTTDRFNL